MTEKPTWAIAKPQAADRPKHRTAAAKAGQFFEVPMRIVQGKRRNHDHRDF